MNLHNLTPASGSVKRVKRIARGQGSGHGGTSTRGHKGAKSRSGYKSKIGFKNINRVEYKAINLDIIQSLIERKNVSEITPEVLRENGLVSRNELVKILGRGELKGKINVTAHKFSGSAKAMIEGQGGNCSEI